MSRLVQKRRCVFIAVLGVGYACFVMSRDQPRCQEMDAALQPGRAVLKNAFARGRCDPHAAQGPTANTGSTGTWAPQQAFAGPRSPAQRRPLIFFDLCSSALGVAHNVRGSSEDVFTDKLPARSDHTFLDKRSWAQIIKPGQGGFATELFKSSQEKRPWPQMVGLGVCTTASKTSEGFWPTQEGFCENVTVCRLARTTYACLFLLTKPM